VSVLISAEHRTLPAAGEAELAASLPTQIAGDANERLIR
jgi:hypothetical protein